MTERRLRCTVTRYSIEQGTLFERTAIEETGAEVRENGYLYLGNSEASAPWADLLTAARESRGWSAQAGSPPVYVAGEGWGGRNYPKIYVSAEALLELDFICDELWSMEGDETREIRGRKVTRSNNNGAPGGRWIIDTGDPYRDIFRNLALTVRELIEPAPAPVPAMSAEDDETTHTRDMAAQHRIDDLTREIRGFVDDPPARDRLPLDELRTALGALERESARIVGAWN